MENDMENNGVKTNGGFLKPERVVQSLAIGKGDYIADFGAGHGYFTIPFARAVGGDGKVYAIDIQRSVLDIVRSRARQEHLLNIEYIRADLDRAGGSRLKDKFLDVVFIANILFQAPQKVAFMQEAYRVLRQGGRLIVIEWNTGADGVPGSRIGPDDGARVKKDDVRARASEAGFEMDREFAAGSGHYGLVFVKR